MNQRSAVYLDLLGILLAIVAALVIGIFVIFLVSDEPVAALQALLIEPFTTLFSFGSILNRMIPLVFTGLAIVVVFQSGVFSMGAEGQLYIGALTGALVAVYLPEMSPWIHIPLVVLASLIGGALYGFLPGVLKAYFKADEIVSTLMFNFIATLFVSYLLNYVFKAPDSGGFARLPFVQESAKLGPIFDGFPTHAGFLLALLAALAVYLLLYKTKTGYELRTVGKNPLFAEYGGIKPKKVLILSIAISGALAGLGGTVEVIGLHGTLKDNFSAGLGFDGIIVSLLARNHPIAVLLSAFFYAYLQVGGQIMQANSDVPRDLAIIIQALLVIFVSSQAIFAYLKQRKLMSSRGGERVAK
ncbi:ABC transporter permease [Brevibacillus borstelensis]|uniref:ABC transporter permease n=1 Tax=Brevibacillus TaxID=55080 RepID=UPI000F078AAF|nr:ABC transporter permease [Brevibacillus borstelensis]MBE5398250.1 ABC transporter permease [Brevibacillus borstelensis]MED1852758.1 ABC transporter permease [Brevibacillus borstelensis]MED1882129.1 ABC transporter permease [Brevibacillus borstelensis]MED2009637.1 ABC transporter permease [Brevibacillus borstelensis]RNB64636.1 ABC transporter permease [Brevibacillus borstelensis]